MKQFQGGFVFKAHRLVYHSNLGLRGIKKRQKRVGDLEGGDVDAGVVARPLVNARLVDHCRHLLRV